VHLADALERDPDFVPALVSLALIRATSPDEALRDGPQAVELAGRACRLTHDEHAEALYALAAGYAQVGRFPEAADTAEAAIQRALAAGNRGLAETIRPLLQVCRQHASLEAESR
jgi:hypothetical protein